MISLNNTSKLNKKFSILSELIEKYQKLEFKNASDKYSYLNLISNYVEEYNTLIEEKTDLNQLLNKFISQPYDSLQRFDFSKNEVVIEEGLLEFHNQFITALIKEGANIELIDSYSLSLYNLHPTTCETILSAGLNPNFLLEYSKYFFSNEPNHYLELALKYNSDISNISYLIRLPSITTIALLIEKGMELQVLLSSILSTGKLALFSGEEAFYVAKQAIELALSKGATLDFGYIGWSNAPIDLYEYVLNHGLKPRVVLDNAIRNFTNDTALIDLSISRGADINKLSSLPVQLSGAVLEKLLNIGLKSEVALAKILSLDFGQGRKYGEITLDPQCKLQESSVCQVNIQNKTLTSDKVSDLAGVVSFLLSQIEDISKCQFANLNIYTVNSLYQSFSTLDNNTLTPTIYLKLALVCYVEGTPEKLKLQKSLVDKVLAEGADFNEIVSENLLSSGENFNFLKYIYFNYKAQLIKNLTPDNLLLLSVLIVISATDNEKKEIGVEGVKIAISNGANVNQELDGSKLINLAAGNTIFSLLKESGARCFSDTRVEEIRDGGLTEIFLNPKIIIEQKYKNLNAVQEIEAKMPYILHQIWLTSPEKPREIRAQDLEIAINTNKHFSQGSAKWEHIVWTNNKTLIPESVKKLEEQGVKVQSIYEKQDDLKLFDIIENLIAEKKWGMASDTLRYSIVEHFGGVYADLNFIFKRDVTSETHKYNFFSKTYGGVYIDNFYFGASPQHPVIEKILFLVERNLVAPPEYITSIDKNSTRYTDVTTANPTFIAYYSEANKHGNIDVIYPQIYKALDEGEIRESEGNSFNITSILNVNEMCADNALIFKLEIFVEMNEISGALSLDVGNDSTDGMTWVE